MEVVFGTSKNYLLTSTYEDAQVLRSFQLQELYESRIHKIPNEYIIFTNNPWYINFSQLNFCGFRFEMKVFLNYIYIFYCNKRNVPKTNFASQWSNLLGA
jgi:hypothetical protein